MKFIEQLKEDRKKLRAMPERSRRLQFIWDYYKIPIACATVLLTLLFLVFLNDLGREDVILYSVFVNTDPNAPHERELLNRALEEQGIPLDGRTVDVEDTMTLWLPLHEEEDVQQLQVLNARFLICDLDLFASDEKTFLLYAEQDSFADLSKLIEAGRIESSPVCTPLWRTNGDGVEVLCGLKVDAGSLLHRAGYYQGAFWIGLPEQAEHMEEALRLLRAVCAL